MAEQPASATESASNRLARRDGGTANSGNNGDPFSVAALRAELERGAEAARRCADPTPMMLPKAPAPHTAVVGGLAAGVDAHGQSMLQEITKVVDTLSHDINQLKSEVQTLQSNQNAGIILQLNKYVVDNFNKLDTRLTRIETQLRLQTN